MPTDHRLVHEWTAGADYRIVRPIPSGDLLIVERKGIDALGEPCWHRATGPGAVQALAEQVLELRAAATASAADPTPGPPPRRPTAR